MQKSTSRKERVLWRIDPYRRAITAPSERKSARAVPAFFLAVIVLALLAAALLRIWLGYRSGSLAAGDITVLRRGLPFGVGAAGLAAVLAVAGLLRKKRRRGFAAGALLWRSLRSC